MKRIERPTYRIAPRSGIIVIAAMALVALSLTATRAAVGSGIGAAENNDSGIRPFRVTFADADLAELRRRIAATRWPEKETVSDHSQGIPLAMIRELARYWATDYDWRKAEAKLNAVPQFITNLDGLDIHFIHVRSKHENALPLIVTHGWPGSIIEQLKIIDPLVNPDGVRRQRVGRIRCGDPVDARVRLLRQADDDRVGPRTHGAGLGPADDASGLHPLCRPGWGLGCVRRRSDGPAGACGTAGHPHQHARHRSSCGRQGSPRPAARRRPVSRQKNGARTSSWKGPSSRSTTPG